MVNIINEIKVSTMFYVFIISIIMIYFLLRKYFLLFVEILRYVGG